jgi:hypothetical protein
VKSNRPASRACFSFGLSCQPDAGG